MLDGKPAINAYSGLHPSSGVSLPESALAEGGDEVTLRIFHFNDFHHRQVLKHSKKGGDTRYFAQMVKIVKQAKSSAALSEAVLFMSAGDDHIGTVLDELLGGNDVDSFVMSPPAYKAYSQAGLDVAVLGNHEFDKGTSILAKMIEANADFPVVSANTYNSSVLKPEHVSPAVIGVVKGIR